ncbi:MAG: 50S ribosomal protein L25 [Candidatus Cloacimonadota bacterium]|nr:50S ribosomal protein L25 [Candidatus Cloacimonadota bacterium]
MKINTEIRNTGKKEVKKLRDNEKIPAILYGKGFESIPLVLDYKEFVHSYKESVGHQSFIFFKVNGKEYRTLIKEMQLDPLSRKIIHIDFKEIYSGQEIEVKIPIKLVGDCPGLIEGGIFDMHLRELEIKCLPKDLPDSFEVDVSKLQIGDSIHIEDLLEQLTNVKILHPPSTPIISVILPKAEKVEVAEEVEEIAEEEITEEGAEEKETKEESEK